MELPEEKPISLYVLKFFLFIEGMYLIFFSGDYCSGFWNFLAVGLGVGCLYVLWALFSGVPRANVWAMNVYLAYAFYCFIGGVGGIPLPAETVLGGPGLQPDVLARWIYIFGIFWSMFQVLAFSRKSVAVWYRPRVRRGYYISTND
jgi:hypothetical protein